MSLMSPISYDGVYSLAAQYLLHPTIFVASVANPMASATYLVMVGSAAMIAGHINKVGAVVLASYAGLAVATSRNEENPVLCTALLMMMVLINAAVSLHKIPGFDNPQVIRNEVISKDAVPFNMYYNFDKAMVAAITMMVFPSPLKSMPFMSVIKIFAALLGITVPTMLVGAYMLNYVRPDSKRKPYYAEWATNNLLLVCPAEESLFREIMQARLLKNCHPAIAVLFAALPFGAAHYQGGKKYMALATLAGCGYGAARELLGLPAAVALHFLVNLIHFTRFTYPKLDQQPSSSPGAAHS